MKFNHSYIILIFLFLFSSLSAGEMNLKLRGDSINGFYVDVYYGAIEVSTQQKSGELNLVVENGNQLEEHNCHSE